MSTPNVPTIIRYTGDGAATQFTIPFPYQRKDYVKVYIARAGETTDTLLKEYQYEFESDQVIKFPIRPEDAILGDGDTLAIQRQTDLGSPYVFDNQRRLFPEEAMNADDLAFQQIQELADIAERTIKVPLTSDDLPEEMWDRFNEGVNAANDAATRAKESEEKATAAANDPNIVAVGEDLRNEPSEIKTVNQHLEDIGNVADNITDVQNVANSLGQIRTVASDIENIDAVANNKENIDKVAAVNNEVSKVAGIANEIIAVNANQDNINAVAEDLTNIDAVGQHINEVDTVADNITRVGVVSQNIDDVVATGKNIEDVRTVSNSIYDVNKVADNIEDVVNVSKHLEDISQVAQDIKKIDEIKEFAEEIGTVSQNIEDVKRVSQSADNIDTVVNNLTNIDTVADNISYVENVAKNEQNINTVADNIDDVKDVAANMEDIKAAKDRAEEARKWAIGSEIERPEGSSKYWAEYAKNIAGSSFHYKGTKPTYSELPQTGNDIGDVWNVDDTGANYAWTGTEWDKLSETVDLSGYYTKEQVDEAIKNIDVTEQLKDYAKVTELNSLESRVYTIEDTLDELDTTFEKLENKVTEIGEGSDTEYPSTKAVIDYVKNNTPDNYWIGTSEQYAEDWKAGKISNTTVCYTTDEVDANFTIGLIDEALDEINGEVI